VIKLVHIDAENHGTKKRLLNARNLHLQLGWENRGLARLSKSFSYLLLHVYRDCLTGMLNSKIVVGRRLAFVIQTRDGTAHRQTS
jgi:hypothetical protein